MTLPLSQRLQALDPDTLGVSDYMRAYLQRMLPVADYYLSIYEHGLAHLLDEVGLPPADVTLIDYGGGHGMLSLLAREMGVGHIIYVDINPESVQAFKALLAALHIDESHFTIIVGDSYTLRLHNEQGALRRPTMVMGADVIEHIYCIDDTLADLLALNPRMPMLFTTASTPYNRRIVRRLRKVMVKDEALFLQKRKDFIVKIYPDLSPDQQDYWARHTRGLNYDDIMRAIDSESPNLLRDPYNTCDPETGSWTERILPLRAYEQLLQPYNYSLQVELGWYNPANRGLKGLLQRHYNKSLLRGKRRSKAPFLFLRMTQNA
ncbi:MAG: SAM-dependent methyltransferase [Bacteroidales bacterium]|nr:SAM-dependent methyltransferase [Bacteroidales bacterium]